MERLLTKTEVEQVDRANALIDEATELQDAGQYAKAAVVLNEAERMLEGLPEDGYVLV